MSSDTPRTERVVRHTSEIASGEVVRADFARQLERDLATMTARAEAAERDAERWISVNESLPPTMVPVLTTDGAHKVTQSYRTGGKESWSAWRMGAVSHWMPLPRPPAAIDAAISNQERK